MSITDGFESEMVCECHFVTLLLTIILCLLQRGYTKWNNAETRTLCAYFRTSRKRPGKEDIDRFLNTEEGFSHSFEIVKAKLNAMFLKFPGASYPYEEYYKANYC